MRSETLLDALDSLGNLGESSQQSTRKALPGLSPEDIQSLKASGNKVALLAGETTDKEYAALQRHRNVLSYSILQSMHSCSRRLILEKLQASSREQSGVDRTPNIDFVFGHAVGAGAQSFLAFNTMEAALYATFISWYGDFDLGKEDWNKRKKKSLESALLAAEAFTYWFPAIADDWEIYTLPNGKPAIEISFAIQLQGAWYFGHIDAILRNKRTLRIAVGEFKTSGYSSIDDALYRNSGQAIGYAVVLDAIVGGLADYDVMYFVYSASAQEWNFLPFHKTTASKLEWVQDRLLDAGHLQQYFKLRHFPKNGANCLQFNRRCQFYGECELVDKEKVEDLPTLTEVPEGMVDYVLSLDEILARQVEGVI